jgi:outer membrane lipoprotein LolB
MPRHSLASLTQCLLILVFTGCASQRPISDDARALIWQENKLKLEQIHSWNLSGRIAIQLQKESGSASLSWKQSGQDYVIRIIAPFGRGTVELRGNSEGVTMRDAGNQLVRARDPETLLLESLGWQVPLTGLNYWIRGLPDPSVKINTLLLDEEARISELSQAGWKVSYGRYMQAEELSMPKKLVMQNQELRVKLVIKQWDLSQ